MKSHRAVKLRTRSLDLEVDRKPIQRFKKGHDVIRAIREANYFGMLDGYQYQSRQKFSGVKKNENDQGINLCSPSHERTTKKGRSLCSVVSEKHYLAID